MCSNKECAEYFKSRKAYDRCFLQLRKKWKSYGKTSGKITLTKTSEEERRAVGGVITDRDFCSETIQFSFVEFEKGLQKTRFAPVDMKELLEEYFGETLLTTQVQRKEKMERNQQFLYKISRYFEENTGRASLAFLWIQEMISEKTYGYQLLIKEYEKDEKPAEALAKNSGNAVMKLKEMMETGEEYPLAVFAAEISGNPHYFDRDTTAGMLFVHGICFWKNMEYPKSAYQWRKLLMEVSVIPDNVSSMVHAYGLRMLTRKGRHLAYDVFCERKEPYVITMENMKEIIGVQPVGKKVYVVENEMVFSYLLNNLRDSDCTLLCTSGQPRSVVQVLIPYILAGGTEVYYSGDADPDGIRIADRLWKKFGDHFHIWRMSPDDYEKSLSKEKIGDTGKTKLENMKHPVLKKTAECMREKLLAGYQENILKELLEDIKQS